MAECLEEFQINQTKSCHISIMADNSTEKPKVLVVNDSIPVLDNLRLVLSQFFEVETAENGMVALQKVKVKNQPCYFDIIILDINMPISDGFDACEKITNYIEAQEVYHPNLFKDFKQQLRPVF